MLTTWPDGDRQNELTAPFLPAATGARTSTCGGTLRLWRLLSLICCIWDLTCARNRPQTQSGRQGNADTTGNNNINEHRATRTQPGNNINEHRATPTQPGNNNINEHRATRTQPGNNNINEHRATRTQPGIR